MLDAPLPVDASVVILSGAGLSAASGVPTFRGPGGIWEGHQATDLATPEAWFANRSLVRRFYDERRLALTDVEPNEGHRALVRLQQALGADRVHLVTQNVDGLIQAAAPTGAVQVLEMHGSVRKVRCEADAAHPQRHLTGALDPAWDCTECGALLRPAVVWFGEVPVHMGAIANALTQASVFVSVGTSGMVYPAAGFVRVAMQTGARCIEINPEPSHGVFHQVVAEGAETALPRIVDAWLA